MIFLPFCLLIISSVCVGMMAECRKGFQVKNGTGIFSTLAFSAMNSTIATVFCLFFVRQYSFNPTRLLLATLYAAVAVFISSVCLIGSAFGNVTVLITSATLGGLVWPSLFGLIFEPQDNRLTLFKIFGFIFAFLCLAFLFINSNGPKGSTKPNAKYIISCILVFICQGSALIIFKIINNLGGTKQYFNFMAEYMLISAFLCGVIMLLTKKTAIKSTEKIKFFNKKSILFAILYALFFFVSEFLSLKCVSMVPLTFQAPMSFCVPIIVTAILERIIYKTRINRKEYLQLSCAVATCIFFIL